MRRRARYSWFSERSPNTWATANAIRPCTSTGKITKNTTTRPSVAATEPRAITMTRPNATPPGRRRSIPPNRPVVCAMSRCDESHSGRVRREPSEVRRNHWGVRRGDGLGGGDDGGGPRPPGRLDPWREPGRTVGRRAARVRARRRRAQGAPGRGPAELDRAGLAARRPAARDLVPAAVAADAPVVPRARAPRGRRRVRRSGRLGAAVLGLRGRRRRPRARRAAPGVRRARPARRRAESALPRRRRARAVPEPRLPAAGGRDEGDTGAVGPGVLARARRPARRARERRRPADARPARGPAARQRRRGARPRRPARPRVPAAPRGRRPAVGDVARAGPGAREPGPVRLDRPVVLLL